MTDIDIDAIRQREQAATKGPWEAAVDDHGRGQVDASVWSDDLSYYIAERISSAPNQVADAEFIAHARTDVPALLAKVDELTAKIERRRLRLVEAEADLLNVRGILSPNGYPRRVPVDLVPTVAPAVQWLADRVDELTVAVAQSREQAATYANEIGTLTAENARLRQQRDGLLADLTDAGNEVDLLTAENTRLRPVVDAAKTWRDQFSKAPITKGPRMAALMDAVDALPKAEATR